MNRISRVLSVTYLWVLLIPVGLFASGVVLNQIVEVANHGKFPVMWPDATMRAHVDSDGMFDNEHCAMTGKTRLNLLADIFRQGDTVYSPGDVMLNAGRWLGPYCLAIWGTLVLKKLLA
jgi:hypothetical protein